VVKKYSKSKVLTVRERLIYEVWLLDTEWRNGGLSQYFGNHGIANWKALSKVATPKLASFKPFAKVVNQVIGKSKDPYEATLKSASQLDEHYFNIQTRLITELKTLAG